MWNIRKCVLVLFAILVFGLIGWCIYSQFSESNKIKTEQNNAEKTKVPTPTKCPDAALPTLLMNGKLYKVEFTENGAAELDEDNFIGTVERKVGYNETPAKEMESNTLPIGTSIYKHRNIEDAYVGIYRQNGLVYYYQIFDNKK